MNCVDIKVGSFIRQWVLTVNGTDQIHLDKRSNLWGIVRQNLDLLPQDYTILTDRSEYISIELLDSDGKIAYNIPAGKEIYVNELYRCYISEAGQNAVKRYLENQLRNAFRVYMVGRFSDGKKEMITHAIGSFLADYDLPMDRTMINRLSKDWYRFRQKNQEKIPLPIFF